MNFWIRCAVVGLLFSPAMAQAESLEVARGDTAADGGEARRLQQSRPPPTNGRPPPEECVNGVEYWDLSDPNWSGERPDPGEEPDPNGGNQSNKGRYYKTGTCFWQSLMEVYGADALRSVQQKMHEEPRDDLPVFPFSPETNRLLIQTYFEPLLGAGVWPLIERYGITAE